MNEHCAICGCRLNRKAGTYAKATVEGRSHATKHHFVAERFFGRSQNRPGVKSDGVFEKCPWGAEGKSEVFCYECHEELLHNPVLLPEDIAKLKELVQLRGLTETEKSESRSKHGGRIQLFQEVISSGLETLLERERQ